MKTKNTPFWLRFIFFDIIFSIAFFFIIFIINKNPLDDLMMLMIKIGAIASISSLFYNLLLESDPEIVD